MKTLTQLSTDLTRNTFKHFDLWKSDLYELNLMFAKFKINNLKTASGANRYPVYFETCLNNLFYQLVDINRDQKLVFCYQVKGKLYANFNPKNRAKYQFTGETKIPFYRNNKTVEKAILNSKTEKLGLFYPCGKPFHIQHDKTGD